MMQLSDLYQSKLVAIFRVLSLDYATDYACFFCDEWNAAITRQSLGCHEWPHFGWSRACGNLWKGELCNRSWHLHSSGCSSWGWSRASRSERWKPNGSITSLMSTGNFLLHCTNAKTDMLSVTMFKDWQVFTMYDCLAGVDLNIDLCHSWQTLATISASFRAITQLFEQSHNDHGFCYVSCVDFFMILMWEGYPSNITCTKSLELDFFCALKCPLYMTYVLHIYLWSKVVCFVLFVMLRSCKPERFMPCSWYLWKALNE